MTFDPTQDIIRTNSGDPIPQIWDDSAQQFVPYEGKVELNGSKEEIINSFVSFSSLVLGGNHFGEDYSPVADNVTHLDVRNYPKKSFVVHNNTDISCTVRYFTNVVQTGNVNLQDDFIDEPLAAGASKWYRIADYPQLEGNHIFSRVTLVFGSDPTGDASIYIFGGSN